MRILELNGLCGSIKCVFFRNGKASCQGGRQGPQKGSGRRPFMRCAKHKFRTRRQKSIVSPTENSLYRSRLETWRRPSWGRQFTVPDMGFWFSELSSCFLLPPFARPVFSSPRSRVNSEMPSLFCGRWSGCLFRCEVARSPD